MATQNCVPGPRVDARELWRVIVNRRGLVGGFALTVVLVAGLVTALTSREYTAETLLLIERLSPQGDDIDALIGKALAPDESDYYKTQFELLESNVMARRVILSHELTPSSLGAERSHLMRLVFGDRDADSPPHASGVSPALLSAYQARLGVRPIHKSHLVEISFSAPVPEEAARIANAHAREFVEQGLSMRVGVSEQAKRFVQRNLDEANARLHESEAALMRYRRDQGIISFEEKENLVIARLAALNDQLVRAEANRIAREAQVRLIEERSYDSLSAVAENELVAALKEEVARLEGERARALAQLRPTTSRVSRIEAHLAQARAKLKGEIASIVDGIQSSYLAAASAETETRAELERQTAAAFRLKEASIAYTSLAREVDTNRQLYEGMLGQIKEMDVTGQLHASNVFVVEAAYPPLKPSSPRPLASLALALFVAIAGGIGIAFVADYFDDSLRTIPDVEGWLGVRVLGTVPDFRHGMPHEDREAAGRDAFRQVRTSILLAKPEPRTLLFTSASPAEGKTAVAINTATMLAQLDSRVLFVDADFRAPRSHQILGEGDGLGLGLADVLTGETEAPAAIRPTEYGIDFLPSGTCTADHTELFGVERMRELLESALKTYEYVVLDAPPNIPLSDSTVLSRLVDGVILVVDQRRTPRGAVQEAVSRLRHARAPILGVVLNCVDSRVQHHARYFETPA